MKEILTFFLVCPISEDQKPINEYLVLKKNIFFEWNNFSRIKKILVLSTFLLFFINFFHLPTDFLFPIFSTYLFLVIIKNSFYYFQLIQLEKNLKSSRIFYEEGSWYDTQIWEKPLLIIKNDQLLNIKKVNILKQKSTEILLFLFSFAIFYQIVF
jgi:Conserved in the green lineage and diatoms 27